jgi:hypothetical protein
MFELVKALNDGSEDLKKRSTNPIGLNAGCELFIAFVTLFPHDTSVNLAFISRYHTSFIGLTCRASPSSKSNLFDKAGLMPKKR